MNIYEQIINTLTPLVKGQLFSTSEIKKLVNKKFGTNPSSIMPYDYCYNRTNDGIDFTKHLFVYRERGKYQYVGENYPYSGEVYHKASGDSEDRVVGEWVDGVFLKMNEEGRIINTFIITYNPAKWDEALIQELIDQLNNGKAVIERWKFGSHKKCKVGDRIFLSRTGANKPGLIGSGFINSPPYQEPNFEHPEKLSWYVDVRFDYLSTTPDTVVIDHATLAEKLNIPKRSFTPQQSGVSFKGDPVMLEEIWQSRTGIGSFTYAEEIPEDEQQEFSEGAKQRITVNKYERDPKARAECIRIHGHSCQVCEFDFEKVYGELGKEYIHVHHLIPLKDIGEKYSPDPKNDLIPVCPNCHAMLHRLKDPSDVEGLKKRLMK